MELYEFCDFQFDLRTRLLLHRGDPVALTPKAADLLAVFLQRSGQVLLKEELLAAVWPGLFVEDRNLNLTVHYLRKALGQNGDHQAFIETVPKRGYRFVAGVRLIRIENRENSTVPFPTGIASRSLATAASSETQDPSTPAAEPSASSMPYPAALPNPAPMPSRGSLRKPFTLIGGAAALLVLASVVLDFGPRPTPYIRGNTYVQLTHDGHAKGGPLLVDGNHVYFTVNGPAETRLASVAIEGGETGTFTLPFPETAFFDLIPNRSVVLVASAGFAADGGDLWVAPLFGGSPLRLGDLKANAAVWSPDRSQIAFVRGTGLFVAASDGSSSRQVAVVPPKAFWLRWSPDGRVLRFSSQLYVHGDSQMSLWQINADGSSLHPLLPGWSRLPYECCGSWTPDGRFFIFTAMHGERSDLWGIPERHSLVELSPPTPFPVTSGPIGFHQPTISNDGTRIFALGRSTEGELMRFESNAHDFVKFLGGISAYWVAYSKSRRSLAYIEYPDRLVWRANADGTQKTQVTFAAFEADGLSWSPDEKYVAVRGRFPGKIWRVYLVPLQGGEPRQLVPGESEQGDPDWSPDGTRLCFGDVPSDYGKPVGNEVIHIFDLRTKQLSDLPGSQGLWSCRWSPDGRYLSAHTIVGDKLLLLDLATNTWRKTAAEHLNTPNWSADSQFIYYDSWPREHYLRRFRVSDGTVTDVADLLDLGRASWWSGLAPDNSPLILVDRSRTEVYSLTLEYR